MTEKLTPVVKDPLETDARPREKGDIRPSSTFFKAVSAVVWKDVQAEVRSRELFSAMLVFSLLMILIFNFALELDVKTRQSVTAGVLWATFAFAGTLGLNRSMSIEKDRGCMDGLLLAPVDRSAIYFGKVISNLAFMLIVEFIVLPVYSVLYNVNLFLPGLLLVIVLGSIGYVSVGTLLAAMSVQTRTRDILLPILLFPIVIPVILAAVKASSGFLTGADMTEIWAPINLLIFYDLVFTAVAFMVFDSVVEE
ncbi:MAG: heme exporter protein CcmB [Syntrophothermus sp.]